MPALDWGAINTALILGLAAYLWRQATKVDAIYQAIFGVDGRNGLMRRIETLEADLKTMPDRIMQSRHDLRDELTLRFDQAVRRITGQP